MKKSNKRALPWLNGTCQEALRRKYSSEGTDDYVLNASACERTIAETA